MAASFNSLPAELVKRIVEMVHEQDQNWGDDGRAPRLLPPAASLRDEELQAYYEKDRTDVSGGMWSYWHGRGVNALATVNKQLYELTAPLVFKSVTPRHLNSHFFRLQVFGRPLAQHIRHVDIRSTRLSPPELVSLAFALQNLPGIDSLSLSGEAMEYASPRDHVAHWRATERDLLQPVLSAALQRISTLFVVSTKSNSLPVVMQHSAAGGVLRHLYLRPVSPIFRYFDPLLASALNALTALKTLEIDAVNGPMSEQWAQQLSLPSLRSLRIESAVNLPDALTFVGGVAPQLVDLYVDIVSEDEVPSDVGPILLPSLRHLSLAACEFPGAALRLLRAPTLHTLRVEIEAAHLANVDDALRLSVDELVRQPTVVELVVLAGRAPSFPAALAATCAARGSHLRVHYKCDDEEILHGRGVDPRMASREFKPGQLTAVRETLRWALERVDWLETTSDTPGMEELAEATLRLRQRQIMEQA